VFNIGVKIAELGAATGFVRMVSRNLALGRAGELPTLAVVGLVPVAVMGVLLAVAIWTLAPGAAPLFGDDSTAEVTLYLRTLAPFLPVAALYSVVVQGTRGFGTMRPQAFVEKIGKAAAQPVAAFVVLAAGAGPRGLALAWVLPAVLAAVPASLWFRALARRAMAGAVPASVTLRAAGGDFWRFAAPRAVSQVFQVTILWFDTLLIGAILGTREAGIYAAATRFLMVGTFVAEAIMQVVGPRISGLVASRERLRAQQVYQAATGWQVLLIWPAFVLIGFFAPVLLELFGSDFVEAAPALALLAGAMVLSSLFGPSDTVILMAGRSSLSLANTVVSLSVNIAGNLLLTPRFGLVGAATAWSLSILIAGGLPAVQAWRSLDLHPWGSATLTAAAVAAGTVGSVSLVTRALVGPTRPGLLVAVVLGGGAFVAVSWGLRDRVGLLDLGRALRRRTAPTVPVAT
jgi:O-antigen/teichoic acid export membrane protein